jgi:hypothetical protein
MCAEASTVLRAVAANSFFNCWCLRSLRITVFGTYQGASTIMRKAFDWKRSRISMLEVETVPQSCGGVWKLVCFTEANIYIKLQKINSVA